MLPLDEARARVLAAVPGLLPAEEVEIAQALGRVLAADLRARADVPSAAVSAMDGYAVPAGAAGRRLALRGESRAGAPSPHRVGAGEAARISTGGALPAGAAAVVRQEDAQASGGELHVRVAVEPGANVRAAGGDLREGVRALAAGTPLGPAELALAVAAGAGRLAVARPPRLAILGTGDELRPPGAPLAAGELHNSNGTALAALATRAGAEVTSVETVHDDPAATRAALERALAGTDVLLVSGGVSVGPHDHVRPALSELGVREEFWRVALMPGKPTWFGARGDQLVFGLPGNPVSAVVTAWLFAVPALRALQGAPGPPPRGTALLAEPLAQSAGRTQAVRVRLTSDAEGVVRAVRTGAQNSHLLTSLLGADGLAFIPPGEEELPAGTPVATEDWRGIVTG